MPWPVEWILAFPRCPYGGVSINVWSMVCASVVYLVGGALLELVGGRQVAEEKTKQKVALPAEKRGF